MEISVIIPTYNRKTQLESAIRSVLAQKQTSIEILVIDDGSTDETHTMMTKLFPEVRYFLFSNRGPAAARNRGIERSHGRWIAFLDSDDQWLPGKIEAQLDFFRKNPEYRICQTEEIWIRNGKRVNPMKKHKKFGGRIFEECLPLCIVSPSAVMIARSLMEETGLFDESLPACEDYDLWLRVAARYPVGLIERPYIMKYGGHADQRSREFPAMDRFRIQSLARILASGILTEDQSKSAMSVLQQKLRIYHGGAIKRGKLKEAREIQDWIHHQLPAMAEVLIP